MENPPKNKLAEWLDHLQQESWQLELVVSGFAIFLLLGALDALYEWNFLQEVSDAGLGQQGAILQLGFLILTFACFFVVVNLVLHVLFRGIWISAIGLRYVSGDINFEVLKLSPRFDRFLRRRIGSFDDYILRLEKLCSVVFAFTFLIVFMLVGFAIFFGLFLTLIYFFEIKLSEWVNEQTAKVVAIPIVLILFFTSLIYFIDFVTLGWLKRVRWFSAVYFPIYRFFSFVTLASLYRPLYYNLVDNKFGRRVGFLLVPYVLAIIFLFSLQIKSYVWFPDEPGRTALQKDSYDDLREEGERISGGSIPSKFIKNGFLEIFISYSPYFDDQALALLCPDSKPGKEIGFGTDLDFTMDGSVDAPALAPDSALACVSRLYEIRVDDSVFQNPVFKFYEHPNDGEMGLMTVLDVNGIPRGPHQLQVRKKWKEEFEDRDTLILGNYFSIPFWKE